MLDTNPSRLTPEEDRTGNEGHESLTSDNVLIYGHTLSDAGWVADRYGAMVTILVGGMRLGEPGAHFEQPGELVIPALPTRFDGIYATAVYEEIAKGTPVSRRIARALDWLGIAWRNTSALDDSTRIRPENGLVGQAFESCVDITYFYLGDTPSLRQCCSARPTQAQDRQRFPA